MTDRECKKQLQLFLRKKAEPKKMNETMKLCMEMVRRQKKAAEEPRTGFGEYLSGIFRFYGLPIFGLQAVTLFLACFCIATIAGTVKYIPLFMPMFVLGAMPVIFKEQFYGMNEMEAVTRNSAAQIILAKLILIGAANLVCITALLCLEISLHNSCVEIVQMILYSLVPYLVSISALLRVVRLRKKDGIQVCAATVSGSCVCWGISAKIVPKLYETSAIGIWIFAFCFFTAFFIKEIYYIMQSRREGKIYGAID